MSAFCIANFYLNLFAVKTSLITVTENLGFMRCFNPTLCLSIPYVVAIMIVIALGSALVVEVGSYIGVNTISSLPFMIMVIVFSLQAFLPLNSIGINISLLNISKATLDRYEDLRHIKVIDDTIEDKYLSLSTIF